MTSESEKTAAPRCQATPGGQQQEADNKTVHPQTENVKPAKESIAYFVIDKMSSYIAGGSSPETAAHFTRGELLAIYKGSHRSRDASGAWIATSPPEALAPDAAMAKCEAAIAEILNYCAETAKAKQQEPPKAPEGRRKRNNELAGLRAFAGREWK